MGTMLLLLGLLAVFVNPLQGDESFQYVNNGYNGETVYHTVNINEQVKVAVFNVYSGRETSNAVFDYSQNIVAYHMPYRGVCVLAHMDINTFPGLGLLEELIHTKREKKKELEDLKKHYFVTNQQVNDLAQYGSAVQGLCWGIPTYWAREYAAPPQRQGEGAQGCAGIHFLFIHVGLCAGFHLF
ncbi:PREDICTED: gastrokine-1-like [Nanorana parkeri]|uniref:gastrokine-1-like n=1 Tax=Nanorana parkeri TaxID=125878 RepID=UPI000854DFC6|nr:PREDICTED: gastrokine-1-like [Nanorana parkeri]